MLLLVMHAGLADREAQTLILSVSKKQGRRLLLPCVFTVRNPEKAQGFTAAWPMTTAATAPVPAPPHCY
jgi:hypothetical protein